MPLSSLERWVSAFAPLHHLLTTGINAISVLSGHIGGANDLAREVAGIIGGREVITTQSDNAGLWALDTFEKRFGWDTMSDEEELQECIYAFVNRKPTALLLEIRDEGTDYMEKTKPEHVTIIDDISDADPEKYELLIMVTPFVRGYCILYRWWGPLALV